MNGFFMKNAGANFLTAYGPIFSWKTIEKRGWTHWYLRIGIVSRICEEQRVKNGIIIWEAVWNRESGHGIPRKIKPPKFSSTPLIYNPPKTSQKSIHSQSPWNNRSFSARWSPSVHGVVTKFRCTHTNPNEENGQNRSACFLLGKSPSFPICVI